MVAPRGRIIVVGGHGPIPFDATILIGKGATVVGTNALIQPQELVASLQAAVAAAVEVGTIRPVVGEEFSLEDAPRAHERISAGSARGKIVLRT